MSQLATVARAFRSGAAAALLLASASAQAAPARQPEAAAPVDLACDALRWTGRLDRATDRDLGPAHSIDEAAAVLSRHRVPFKRDRGIISLSMATAELNRINMLPQGEPIIFPDAEGGTICTLVPSEGSV